MVKVIDVSNRGKEDMSVQIMAEHVTLIFKMFQGKVVETGRYNPVATRLTKQSLHIHDRAEYAKAIKTAYAIFCPPKKKLGQLEFKFK